MDSVYEVTGDNESNIDAVNRCIDKIRSIPEVASTNTLIILRSWS